MPATRPAKWQKRNAVEVIENWSRADKKPQPFPPPQATRERGEVKAEAFAFRNRRLEEVDLGRIQAERPEGRPLIAAEWTELTAHLYQAMKATTASPTTAPKRPNPRT
jgi:hypothetical protein